MKTSKFYLYHQDKHLWDIEFHNNAYTFQLSPDITKNDWESMYGIIPITEWATTVTSDNFFEQLNVRFPLTLRKLDMSKKIDYIRKNHLRVASDSYELRQV